MTTSESFRKLELNNGRVDIDASGRYDLVLPAVDAGYADAQIDDYGGLKRRRYPWRPGTRMRLKAKFSHEKESLVGTAGFGFWNAPFGDPTIPLPALPQAAWFFFGSPPNDLPLALEGAGRGWFASTVDAGSKMALALIPAAPFVVLGNQFRPFRERVWPWVRQQLGITFEPIDRALTEWHTYEIGWEERGCAFLVDGEIVLQSAASPTGPLGFVCWIDNQYMVLTNRGRFGWGTLSVAEEQTLAVTDLEITTL